jgi:hypothetical protein
MKTLLRTCAILLATIAVIGTPRTTSAETIEWGFDAPFSDSIDSFGTDLDASFVFQLGDFTKLTTSFTPDRTNVADWSTNWQPFASTTYNDGTNTFRTSSSITDNTVFGAGDQAYIWGSNSGISTSGEFALLTSAAWTFPSATISGPAISYFELTNGGTDTGVTAIVGAIDSSYSGSETGISFDASGGDGFDLQTEAIPEPASALFFSVSAIWFLFRRPRRATS